MHLCGMPQEVLPSFHRRHTVAILATQRVLVLAEELALLASSVAILRPELRHGDRLCSGRTATWDNRQTLQKSRRVRTSPTAQARLPMDQSDDR